MRIFKLRFSFEVPAPLTTYRISSLRNIAPEVLAPCYMGPRMEQLPGLTSGRSGTQYQFFLALELTVSGVLLLVLVSRSHVVGYPRGTLDF